MWATSRSNMPYSKQYAREAKSYQSARARVLNPNTDGNDRYRHLAWGYPTFADFLTDLGPRPPGTTLDRKDNAKGYKPGNCRWATPRKQALNRAVTTEWPGAQRQHSRWSGRIVHKGKWIHLGMYDSPEEAHLAYLFAIEVYK